MSEMREEEEKALRERVAALEARVSELQRQVARLREAAPADPPPSPGFSRPDTPPAVRPAVRAGEGPSHDIDIADRVRGALRSEDWLNKIGIALLLFGLAFLFKYSIDQGWVTPLVRVAFGGALGVFLLTAGLRLHPHRRRYGQVLLGGSIATFYVTIFSAYQLFDLIAYAEAFGAMAVVTLVVFALAVQQRDAALGVIATLGGLGTPFMLYTGAGSVAGLVAYTCAVLASAMGIWFYRGWRTLLLAAVVGGWLVFVIGWADLTFNGPAALVDRGAFQAGALFCWIAFGVLPVVRAVLRYRQPDRWAGPALRYFKGSALAGEPALALAVVAPVLTLGLSYELWDVPDVVRGLVVVGAAGLYAGAYGWLRRRGLPGLASAHGVAAALLLAFSLFDLTRVTSIQFLAFAVEAAVVHVLARHFNDRALRFVGHAFFALVALIMAGRLLDLEGVRPPLVNEVALVDLMVLVLVFSAAWTFRSERLRMVYGLAAYVGLLGWFWRDLVGLSNGQAYVSVAWGLCAVGLLALGWHRDADLVRNAGLGTLLVVVGKLFVVDLAKLEAVWRILLFLGFGGLLLMLSYFFPSLWKPAATEEAETAGGASKAPPPG